MTNQLPIPANFPPSIPRGTRRAAAVAAAVIDLFRRAPHPKLGTSAHEAAKVRAWACKLAASDPRLAGDLYVAADRHGPSVG